jgi:hypothetical protein
MLGEAGAAVYCSGRSTLQHPCTTGYYAGRPETIEGTAELVARHGGEGIAVRTDHLAAEQIQALVDQIRKGHSGQRYFRRRAAPVETLLAAGYRKRLPHAAERSSLAHSYGTVFLGRRASSLEIGRAVQFREPGSRYGFTDLDGSQPDLAATGLGDYFKSKTRYRWRIQEAS